MNPPNDPTATLPAEADNEPAPAPARLRRRADALDALRGLSILAMIYSSAVPYGTLPAWMYHAQDPPPTHVTDTTLPGITWVDLVFPFFLFTMGAAIPLALARRAEQGMPTWKLVVGILWRGVLLAAFAFYRQHVAPYSISESPTTGVWLIALAAMALVFVVWGRFPATWPAWRRLAAHGVGWVAAIALLASIHYPDGGDMGLSVAAMRRWVGRVDIIILVLANVSVFGSLLWLVTRHSWWARLVPVGLLLALKISSAVPGWPQDVWAWSPLPWLYRMEYLKYLMIVLPGTIVGEMLLAWIRRPADAPEAPPTWSAGRLAALGLLGVAMSVVVVVGLFSRNVPEATLGALAVGLAMAWLARAPSSELERLLARLLQWGGWWLALGLCFEPFEGGIKKSATTISYMFVPLGLGILVLLALTAWMDGLGLRRAGRLLTDSGQNPLAAYIGYGNLIVPVYALSGLKAWVDGRALSPWAGAGVGALLTLALALFAAALTRLRIFVRA